MRKSKYTTLIGCALIAVLSACSHISEDERYIYVPMPQAGKCILIEDFTGQDCVNCPTATAIVEQLQATYTGDTIIAVAIHSGPLGVMPSERHPDGLATALGNTYYNYWKCQYQPTGLIDRSDGLLDKELWTAKTLWDLKQPSTVNILLGATSSAETIFSADGQPLPSFDVNIQVVGTSGTTAGKLQVWLTEDNIVAFQKMPDGSTKTDYVHNHVLRDAVNGTWGEDVSVGEGEVRTFNYQFTPSPAWRAENLAIVAFVYNDEGVVQAARAEVRGEN